MSDVCCTIAQKPLFVFLFGGMKTRPCDAVQVDLCGSHAFIRGRASEFAWPCWTADYSPDTLLGFSKTYPCEYTMRPHCKAFFTCLISLTLFGCGATGPTDVKSTDGQFEITVFDGMAKATELNAAATIQAMNGFRELYVVVMSEPKGDFPEDFTVEQFAEVASSQLSTAASTSAGAAKKMKTTAGDEAVQHDIHGSVDGIKIGYVATFVDTGEHFHQVLAWTLDEKFSQNRETLAKICASFRKSGGSAATGG